MPRLWLFLLFATAALSSSFAHAQRQAGAVFRDCPTCPEMVVIPPGTFQMGSTEAETTREGVPNEYAILEKPVHTVTIPKALAAGKFAVTWVEFAAFSCETGNSPTGCWYWDAKEGKPKLDDKRSWKDPGFLQTSLTQPVVCVSWEDTQQYVKWLSGKTGQAYLLLSEAEWEYAARASTKTARYWGEAIGSGNAPTATVVAVSGTTAERRHPGVSSQMALAYTICSEMRGNGPAIAGTKATMGRL